MKKTTVGNPHIASPYVVWSAIFIIVPLIMVAYYSFTDESETEETEAVEDAVQEQPEEGDTQEFVPFKTVLVEEVSEEKQEEVIMPIEAEPERPRRKVNIAIAVDD